MRRTDAPIVLRISLLILVLGAGRTHAQPLQARALPTKPATVGRPQFESKLWVKFRDDLKVRAANGNLASRVGANLAAVRGLQQRFGLSFVSSVCLPQETLDFVETRAAQLSRIAQPDIGAGMMVSGPAATLADAADALLALDEVEWAEFVMLNPEPPQACSDIPPTTPNYFAQGYQPYHGPNPVLNMSCAWTYGGRGQNIRIADCEYAYRPLHEDRCTVNGPPLNCVHGYYEDHGSAVLGEMVGLSNAYGCTGLTPDAVSYFFSEFEQTNCSWTPPYPCPTTREAAIVNATANLGPGDVLLLEMQISVPGSGYGPAELNYCIFQKVLVASNSGIVVVAAAGNGYENLDRTNNVAINEWRSWGDSGAIIVGAGTSNVLHDRLWFSTYGSRVNVQGWGENVFSLGYGDFADYDPGDPDGKQTYTNTFNGTSSASPFVASAAASLQSIRAANGLSLLTPSQIRQLLIDTGIPQGSATASTPIGPFPDMGKAILQLGFGATDCNANGVPDECERPRACCLPPGGPCIVTTPCDCYALGGEYFPTMHTCTGVYCALLAPASGP